MPKLSLHAKPPRAIQHPHSITQLGKTRTDDYAWLKDENWQIVMSDPSKLHPDIRAHLEAENSYTKAVLAPLEDLKAEIFAEMKARQEPEESSVPVPDGKFAYYHRYRTGDQYGVYMRVPINHDTRDVNGAPIDLLDADALAGEAHGFFDLGAIAHSPDHKWLAYSVDRKGSEIYSVFVKGVEKDPVATGIKKSAGSLQWAKDSRTLFWVERDENQRPYAVFARDIFDTSATPRLVYKETDPGFFVSISESDSGNFIEISAHNHTTSEVWIVPANAPETPAQCVAPRQAGREYSLHDHGDYFYILTNAHDATDFQIMRAPIARPSPEHWTSFIPHQPGTLIIGVETYAHYMVRLVRENALPKIIIRDMKTGEEHVIAQDESAYGLGLSGGCEYDTPWLRYVYSSPTTPRQTFDYHMKSKERRLRKTQSVPSGHNPSDYQTERIMLPARDGADIPVTLLKRADTPQDGSAPLLLYGYGSYGITIPAEFRTTILSLVDRGFIYAIAHIRGGKAKGYQWYLDGKLDKKPNTFNDFVDVGRGLCEADYTDQGQIIAHGGSAGGLLVGAAVNQAPELFGGIIAAVPFVDVLNTMSDDTLPLTPPEWPEWGNPLEDADAYTLIQSYSPYDNIIARDYPPMLITAGLTDPRVTYWEPAKWVAKLRDNQTGSAPILLKTNMDAGHQGQSGRYDSLKDVALEYAFAVSVIDTNASGSNH